MTRSFVLLRRISALTVAITLFAAPIASAQSTEAARPIAARANPALLSPAAFARLVQPAPTGVAPAPVVANAPRASLLRQGTAAFHEEARPVSAQPPRRSSAGWGKKTLVVIGVVGAVVGLLALSAYTGADFGDLWNGLSGSDN